MLLLLHYLCDEGLDVVELAALQEGVVPCLQLTAPELLVEPRHVLLEAHDLLGLRQDLVGDGGGRRLELLVDPGDLLVQVPQLLDPVAEVLDLVVPLHELLLVSLLLLLIVIDPVLWVLEAFLLELLCESRSLDADA